MKYPEWTCRECAERAGGRIPESHVATWHNGTCPICGHYRPLTEPRDYGYPKFEKCTQPHS